jgi:hypothetical protein
MSGHEFSLLISLHPQIIWNPSYGLKMFVSLIRKEYALFTTSYLYILIVTVTYNHTECASCPLVHLIWLDFSHHTIIWIVEFNLWYRSEKKSITLWTFFNKDFTGISLLFFANDNTGVLPSWTDIRMSATTIPKNRLN